MSDRRLTVLGTAGSVPTRRRNHNGYELAWDDEHILFDPGEGTQRQMLHAGVSAARLTRICITHLHGDHCLGLPGVLVRRANEWPGTPVDVHYPAASHEQLAHLCAAADHDAGLCSRAHPTEPGRVLQTSAGTLVAVELSHPVPTLGWRLEEPDGRRMLPDRLEAAGVRGPDVARLQRDGVLHVGGRRVHLDEVSAPRPGQRFAFVMDTRLCDAAFELARDADLLVCESTFLEDDADLAERFGHLTAGQAARIAAESGARRLVLTHFSQRYGDDVTPYVEEATRRFDDVVAVDDFDVVEVPSRHGG
jgi:ribonuclease Z